MFLLTNTSIGTLNVNEGGIAFKLYPGESITLTGDQVKALGENRNPALLVSSVDGTPLSEALAAPVVDQEAAIAAIASVGNTRIGGEVLSPNAAKDLDRTSDAKLAIYNDREKIEILERDAETKKVLDERKAKLEELKKSGTVEENKTAVAKAADPAGDKQKDASAKAAEVKK